MHPSSFVDAGATIGEGTHVWHFCHVMEGAVVGRDCSLGQNVFVAESVTIGNNVKIQNNVSVYSGVELEDCVFCGPSCVFTNVRNPRSEFPRRHLFEKTLVRRGATLGANSTVVCGTTVGRYAFVAAGAVITRDTPDYALMMGMPARQAGWIGRHGHRLRTQGSEKWICPESGWIYLEREGRLRCLDWPEDRSISPTETAS